MEVIWLYTFTPLAIFFKKNSQLSNYYYYYYFIYFFKKATSEYLLSYGFILYV